MIDGIERIRNLNKTEQRHLLSWAEKEGWNPGLHDADSFWRVDPDGFLGIDQSISDCGYSSPTGMLSDLKNEGSSGDSERCVPACPDGKSARCSPTPGQTHKSCSWLLGNKPWGSPYIWMLLKAIQRRTICVDR